MNHQEVRKLMGEYLQGDLTLRQRALLDAHLDGCVACAEDLRSLRATVDLLRELPGPEVPPHLTDRVFARIQDGEGRAGFWDGVVAFWEMVDPARYLPPLAGAALTTAVVIVGVRDLGWQIPGLSAPRPPAVQLATELDAAAEAEEAPRALRSEADSAPAERVRPPATVSRLASSAPPAAPRSDAASRVDFGEPPPVFLQRPFGARAAPAPLAAGRAAPEPADDLELALADPVAFVQRFHAMRPAEAREAWLRSVAEHAHERRTVREVTARLREAGGDEGHALAVRFEGVAQAVAR